MRATGPQQWALTLSRTGKNAGCLGGVVVTVSLDIMIQKKKQ